MAIIGETVRKTTGKNDEIIRGDSVAGQPGAVSEDDEEEIFGEEGGVFQGKEIAHQPANEKYNDHMKTYIKSHSGSGVPFALKGRGIMIHISVMTTRMSRSYRRRQLGGAETKERSR